MNATIAMITARGLLGRRRSLLLIPLPLILIGLAAVARATGTSPRDWSASVLIGLGLATVLPLVSLIVGTAVLGSEIDDGTVVHLLAKPLPRRQIVLTKLAVAAAVSAATASAAMFVAGLFAGSVRLAAGLAVGTALAAVAYSALFLALSLVSRRPVLIGLGYVLIWEGILGNLLSGTASLSIQQYAVEVADRVSGSDLLTGRVSLPVALVMSAVFIVGGTVLAVDRLRSFSVAGETG